MNTTGSKMVHVIQGEFKATGDGDVMLTTILGSCVSACLWDEDVKVGGMNHIVLPEGPENTSKSAYLGINAMELLINDLIKLGANRSRLQCKLFGGARMIDGLSDVGQRNAAFVEDFLAKDGIPCLSKSLGGTLARKIQFWPTTGAARQMLIERQNFEEPAPVAKPKVETDDLELF